MSDNENVIYDVQDNDPRRVIRGRVAQTIGTLLVVRYHPDDRDYFNNGEKISMVLDDWSE